MTCITIEIKNEASRMSICTQHPNPGTIIACLYNLGLPSGQPRAISIGSTRVYGYHFHSVHFSHFQPSLHDPFPYVYTCGLKPRDLARDVHNRDISFPSFHSQHDNDEDT